MLHKSEVDQKEIVFVGVPGHAGIIWENKAADGTAKEALDKEPTDDLMCALFRPKTLDCQIYTSSHQVFFWVG